MADLCRLALTMSHKLGAAQFSELGKLLASSIERQTGICSEADGTHTCTRLAVIGVGTSKVQLAPMQSFEVVSKSGHGGTGSAMFLEESNISTPLGKALSKRSEASDVLGLHDGDARADRNGGGESGKA